MTIKFLAATSSAALLIFAGLPGHAQNGPAECGPGEGTPCTIDGEMVTPKDARDMTECPVTIDALTEETFPCVTVAGDVLTEVPEDETVLTEMAEDPAGAAQDMAAEAAAAPAAETEAQAEADMAAEAEVETAELPEDGAEEQSAEAAPAEAAPVEEAEVTESAEAIDEPVETVTEEPAEVAEEAPAEPEVVAEETTEPEGKAPVTAEAEVVVEPETTVAEDATPQERPGSIADIIFRDEAPQTTAAASAEGDAEAEVEVVEEKVTEENTRSSSEEFDTKVGETVKNLTGSGDGGEATTTARAGDDGLSDFQKALLAGLGAIAVGQLLDNGDEIVSNSGDRVVVLRDGEYRVLKNDDVLLRQPGSDVRTERFSDGSTRETLTRPNGTQIVTIRGADGLVLRRVRILPDGERIVLFDDTQQSEAVDVSELPETTADTVSVAETTSEEELRRALEAALAEDVNRTFSLRQVRNIRAVRELAPQIEVDAITFASGSAVIRPSEAEELADLGRTLKALIEQRPGEVFLVEGHTDAVGPADYNLALSDRRAESLALALTEYFDVPPENLIVQGYGEQALKIQTERAEEANRRAAVRRITTLLASSDNL